MTAKVNGKAMRHPLYRALKLRLLKKEVYSKKNKHICKTFDLEEEMTLERMTALP